MVHRPKGQLAVFVVPGGRQEFFLRRTPVGLDLSHHGAVRMVVIFICEIARDEARIGPAVVDRFDQVFRTQNTFILGARPQHQRTGIVDRVPRFGARKGQAAGSVVQIRIIGDLTLPGSIGIPVIDRLLDALVSLAALVFSRHFVLEGAARNNHISLGHEHIALSGIFVIGILAGALRGIGGGLQGLTFIIGPVHDEFRLCDSDTSSRGFLVIKAAVIVGVLRDERSAASSRISLGPRHNFVTRSAGTVIIGPDAGHSPGVFGDVISPDIPVIKRFRGRPDRNAVALVADRLTDEFLAARVALVEGLTDFLIHQTLAHGHRFTQDRLVQNRSFRSPHGA